MISLFFLLKDCRFFFSKIEHFLASLEVAFVEIEHSARIAALAQIWILPRLLAPVGAPCPERRTSALETPQRSVGLTYRSAVLMS